MKKRQNYFCFSVFKKNVFKWEFVTLAEGTIDCASEKLIIYQTCMVTCKAWLEAVYYIYRGKSRFLNDFINKTFGRGDHVVLVSCKMYWSWCSGRVIVDCPDQNWISKDWLWNSVFRKTARKWTRHLWSPVIYNIYKWYKLNTTNN